MIELEIMVPDAPAGLPEMMSRVSRIACAMEGIEDGQAYVRLTDDEAIRALNRETRGIDRATDVLSFPTVRYVRGTAKDNGKRLRREIDPETGRVFLGDIVISLDRARAQAAEYGHSEARELGYLIAHAMFHLLGYDHMESGDRAAMRAMEERVMAEMGLKREEEKMTDQELFNLASQAALSAYVPYSNFRVGACLLSKDGRVFTGCNIENASYGATICAERTAVVKAVSEGVHSIEAIAIAAEKGAAWPCGVCRQVLNEFSGNMRVLVGQIGGTFESTYLSELLPHAFGPDQLR